MHLKDNQKLGWKEIASHFNNRTPNACQFRWRRLKSGNLKNPPKSAAALGAQFKQNPNMNSSSGGTKKKKATTTSTSSTTDNFTYNPMTTGTFQGFDNSISTALAGLNALSNSPSYISGSSPATPKGGVPSSTHVPGNNDSSDNINRLNHKYEASPGSDSPNASSASANASGSGGNNGGGYYADVSVDPTMNLPHHKSHPGTPSSLTPRNSTSGDIKNINQLAHRGSISGIANVSALRNNSIIQITTDERGSVSSLGRASVSSLPSKSMKIPHHESGNTALAHLPVLFGGAGGSISGPSRHSSISGASSLQQSALSSLRNGSVVNTSPGYFSRSGSVVIPHNADKKEEEPLKFDKERSDLNNKKLNKIRRNLPSSAGGSMKSKRKHGTPQPKLDIPWTMEEDELLINRRNRELSFAELSILLPQRTEGEIWARIDHLEKLRNGAHRTAGSRDSRRLRQESIGLDDVDDFYDDDDDDDDDVLRVSDDEDVLVDVDDISHPRKKKRRMSSAVNPLTVRGTIRK
ncbi:TOD6 Transcriptional regulatory protein TOD6 [Candida maltosa Xu316]